MATSEVKKAAYLEDWSLILMLRLTWSVKFQDSACLNCGGQKGKRASTHQLQKQRYGGGEGTSVRYTHSPHAPQTWPDR